MHKSKVTIQLTPVGAESKVAAFEISKSPNAIRIKPNIEIFAIFFILVDPIIVLKNRTVKQNSTIVYILNGIKSLWNTDFKMGLINISARREYKIA